MAARRQERAFRKNAKHSTGNLARTKAWRRGVAKRPFGGRGASKTGRGEAGFLTRSAAAPRDMPHAPQSPGFPNNRVCTTEHPRNFLRPLWPHRRNLLGSLPIEQPGGVSARHVRLVRKAILELVTTWDGLQAGGSQPAGWRKRKQLGRLTLGDQSLATLEQFLGFRH